MFLKRTPRSITALIEFLGIAILGFTVAITVNLDGFEKTLLYYIMSSGILSIGLYGAAFGIEPGTFKKNLKILIPALTIGVAGKAIFIGGPLALIYGEGRYLMIGIVLAQMDPLIVNQLTRGSKYLSPRAKDILMAWASYDDPATMLAGAFLAKISFNEIDIPRFGNNFIAQIIELVAQIGIAFVAIGVYWLISQLKKSTVLKELPADTNRGIKFEKTLVYRQMYETRGILILGSLIGISYFFLIGWIALASFFVWMFCIAIIGRYIRPNIGTLLEEKIMPWLFRGVALLIGIIIFTSSRELEEREAFQLTLIGFTAGAFAYMSQIVAGFLLTWGLTWNDRVKIALAHQNGMTAANLALFLAPAIAGVTFITGVAIVLIYILNWGCNKIADRYLKLE